MLPKWDSYDLSWWKSGQLFPHSGHTPASSGTQVSAPWRFSGRLFWVPDFPALCFGLSLRFGPDFYISASVIHLVLGLFLPLTVPCLVYGSWIVWTKMLLLHSEDYYRQYLCLSGLLSASVGFSVGIIPHVNSQMTFNCGLLCISNKRTSVWNSVAEFCVWVQFPKLVKTSNSDEGKRAEVRFHRLEVLLGVVMTAPVACLTSILSFLKTKNTLF